MGAEGIKSQIWDVSVCSPVEIKLPFFVKDVNLQSLMLLMSFSSLCIAF